MLRQKDMKISVQGGFMLLESLIAILIFSFGVLGMVAINARSVQASADAEYRAEAARLADEIAGRIALEVNRGADRTSPTLVANAIAADLPSFAQRPGGANCAFAGADSAQGAVTDWLTKARLLPGAAGVNRQQILVDVANFNRVTITLCWQAPNDQALRNHTLVTYIN